MKRATTDVLYFETGPANVPTLRVQAGETFEVQTQLNRGPWLDEHPDGPRLAASSVAETLPAVAFLSRGPSLAWRLSSMWDRSRLIRSGSPGFEAGTARCPDGSVVRGSAPNTGSSRFATVKFIGATVVSCRWADARVCRDQPRVRNLGQHLGRPLRRQPRRSGADYRSNDHPAGQRPGRPLHVGDMHAQQETGECAAGGHRSLGRRSASVRVDRPTDRFFLAKDRERDAQNDRRAGKAGGRRLSTRTRSDDHLARSRRDASRRGVSLARAGPGSALHAVRQPDVYLSGQGPPRSLGDSRSIMNNPLAIRTLAFVLILLANGAGGCNRRFRRRRVTSRRPRRSHGSSGPRRNSPTRSIGSRRNRATTSGPTSRSVTRRPPAASVSASFSRKATSRPSSRSSSWDWPAPGSLPRASRPGRSLEAQRDAGLPHGSMARSSRMW